jgi:glycine/D-amino acid oxidase-like deaminating enzyme
MKHDPYWWELAPREAAQSVEQPKKVDVAIIGAGYSGLSAALVLARSGLSVAVFEAGQIGEGASSRNGGMVGASFHKLGIAGLKSQYGEEKTNEIIRESVGFVDFLEDFLKTEKIDAQFKRTGRFRGALKPSHFDQMARELEVVQKACGVKGEMIQHYQQETETGSKGYFGGVVFHADGGLHQALFHNGLVDNVRKAGAIILAHTPVEKLTGQNGHFTLKTPRGTTQAEQVAICTNGYTGTQFPEFRRRILPIRSAIISTEPLPGELMSRLMPKGRMYGDSRRMIVYFRRSPDGTRILFGSRATELRDKPEKNAQMLFRSLVEIYPELKATKISHVWSGLIAYSFDHAPHIGQHNGLYFAMGYCGSGVARATYFGQKLGYKILNQEERGRTAFDDLPFQSKPFYSGNPWFMPLVLNWHRLADRMGI